MPRTCTSTPPPATATTRRPRWLHSPARPGSRRSRSPTTTPSPGSGRRSRRPGAALEVIPGVELSAEFGGREVHILGYFVRPDDRRLTEHLGAVCDRRRERFRTFIDRLDGSGCHIPGRTGRTGSGAVNQPRPTTPGRAARPRRRGPQSVRSLPAVPSPDQRRRAGESPHPGRGGGPARSGTPTASAPWRTPPRGDEESLLTGLRNLGLLAVEAVFPAASATRTERLRGIARKLGLAVTGGSDCHGPEVAGRAVGARGVTRDELDILRHLAGSAG